MAPQLMQKTTPVTTMADKGGATFQRPVAIVDIGSNSVRLVAYEGLARAPTAIFNEKVLCGLGRGVMITGQLPQEGIDKALQALRRFKILARNMHIDNIAVLATAAVRDAQNGKAFLKEAEAAIGEPIDLLTGADEAELSALGVLSGIYQPDGVAGDLGGGSLELIQIADAQLGEGITLPLGGLALADAAKGSPRAAVKIVRDALASAAPLQNMQGRTFYAVGGTWRALARLHMRQRNYPLKVMHNYIIPARDAADFAGLVERVETDSLVSIGSVAAPRRPLLSYGAIVLEEIIRIAAPKEIVLSASGVREGLLYKRLSQRARTEDPLLAEAHAMNRLRSRAPRHGEELCAWSDQFLASTHLEETTEETRLRHVGCLLADVAWRAHPDYRGEQSMNLIAHAPFLGIDHAGRAFLALAVAYRHEGIDSDVSPQIRALISARQLDRARILGAVLRVAYLISTAMPDVLGQTPMRCSRTHVKLSLPARFAPLMSDRLQNRLKQLAKLIGREPQVNIIPED